MKIWQRIIIGFLIVIVVMVGVDLFTLRNNLRLIAQLDDLELSKGVELDRSNEIAYQIVRNLSDTRAIFIAADTKDRAELEEMINVVKSEAKTILRLKQELLDATQLGKDLSEEIEDVEREKEELKEIHRMSVFINDFIQYQNHTFDLLEENKIEEAEAFFNQKADSTAVLIQRQVENIVFHARGEVDDAIKLLNKKVRRSFSSGVYFSILGMFIGILIAYYIGRSISKPLNQLVRGTKEIRKGNYEPQFDFKNQVEIMQLGNSFKKMAQDLKERIESISELNEELKESNSTKDTFFEIIGHDLKNPFNSVLGFTDLLENQYNDFSDEERQRMIHEVNTSAVVIYEMLDNLLTWARAQSDRIVIKPKSLRLSQVVGKSIESFRGNAEQKNITVTSRVDPVINVWSDRYILSVVINNILSNAVKFTPEYGTVTIDAHIEGDYAELSIEDTGVGMSSEIIDHLNHPEIRKFRSTLGTNKEIGTGLGLYLIREFINKNQGQLWVESVAGEGTSFRFTMPIAPNS